MEQNMKCAFIAQPVADSHHTVFKILLMLVDLCKGIKTTNQQGANCHSLPGHIQALIGIASVINQPECHRSLENNHHQISRDGQFFYPDAPVTICFGSANV